MLYEVGRDLLYKPPVPFVTDEQQGDVKRKPTVGKGRELGSVGEQVRTRTDPALEQKKGGLPAYKAAYFNEDISGVRQVNLRGKGAQALRGEEGASDLRKVVLPPAHGIENPNPDVIRSAADLMGLEPGFLHDLAGLLTRQGAMARSNGVTREMLEARMAMLEIMVEARKAALERMRNGRSKSLAKSKTLELARGSQGNAMANVNDVALEGTELIREVRDQADGLHRRLTEKCSASSSEALRRPRSQTVPQLPDPSSATPIDAVDVRHIL